MLVALVSAKGSPGVTTTGLAMVAAAGAGDALLVEADPAGGDLECWCGPLGEPGLLAVATDVARDADSETVAGHAVEVTGGVRAIVAPTSESAATATIVPMVAGLGATLAMRDTTVVMDCGRWSPAHRASGLVGAAGLVVVVCRPTLDSIEHARGHIDALRRVNRAVAGLVVGGTQPYGPDEVAAALGVPVVGVLPWDPRGVMALVEDGASARAWQRSALARATPLVLEGVAAVAGQVWSHG
jgi:MinD-like ATPase involved in chromosome partitioning or flagellar assembly